MNSLAEAFCLARRHTRAEKRRIVAKAPTPKEDFSDLMDEAFLHDVRLSTDFDREYDLARQARPVSVRIKPGATPQRFAQTH